MPIKIEWPDIAMRLICTLAAGRPAGLRTTMLVALAACLAMIQVNLLLPTGGRPANSFVMNDLMRLPLGILSGMGFIGAGAIVRRDNFAVGITTAATLWFVTVIGMCFGGGQIAIGLVSSAIGVVVLTALKVVEDRLNQDRQGRLSLVLDSSGPSENDIRSSLVQAGSRIAHCAFAYTPEAQHTELNCDSHWLAAASENEVPGVIRALAERPGVIRIAWAPQAK